MEAGMSRRLVIPASKIVYDPEQDIRKRKRESLRQMSLAWQQKHGAAASVVSQEAILAKKARTKEEVIKQIDEALKVAHERFGFATPRSRYTALIKDIARRHGLSINDLKGRSRRIDIVNVRFEAMAAVYRMSQASPNPLSYGEIGRYFGNRDHSTIIHALRKVGVK